MYTRFGFGEIVENLGINNSSEVPTSPIIKTVRVVDIILDETHPLFNVTYGEWDSIGTIFYQELNQPSPTDSHINSDGLSILPFARSFYSNIKQYPLLTIYCAYIKDDAYSQDYYDYFKNQPIIKERLIGCEFINNPTREELDKYLINSTKSDFLLNGMTTIQFLSLFDKPNNSILPYTYDRYGNILPEMNEVQSDNLKGNFAYIVFRGINTSLLWRQGLEDLTNKNFSINAFDTLQVQNYLSSRKSPDFLEGAAGVLQFDPITKDRKYINATRYDFTIEKKYIINSIIFDDPLLGNFVSFKV